jgi:predicted DCC family thiol-disulfide oxidoreductase YuxK
MNGDHEGTKTRRKARRKLLKYISSYSASCLRDFVVAVFPHRIGAMPTNDLTVIYDGQCELCRWSRSKLEQLDRQKKLTFVNLHDAAAMSRFPQIEPEEALTHMIAISDDGREARGYEGFALILEAWPYTSMLRWIMRRRLAKIVGTKIYAMIARNRYRIRWLPSCGTSCSIKH